MSYQVLARKWRPRLFKEMVGQEHVLKALINALDHDRLHHAYLFTGTRGVGKTTIARILAKCLNCERGVSSEPCNQCSACVEINDGHFVDLIEVDAASRTKVEDTRELLDNVQYMPSKGRYKVYLIDEVHMLSGHSFNALLKTLEEPPPHVKFLLATTDPQKLPITVLSRCLQFNLKNLSPERIEQYLEFVLGEEKVPFESSALWLIARSADGSMRDALSLTDQAVSFGNGQVTEADVSTMLGTIDQRQIVGIVQALRDGDGSQLLRCVESMAERIPDYAAALAELTVLLHRIAIAQVVPESIDNTFGDRDHILQLAQQLAGEDVQLFYQCAILGRKDLPLAPDPRAGFEMVLLRMLAFKPQRAGEAAPKPQVQVADEPVKAREGGAKKSEPVAATAVVAESAEAISPAQDEPSPSVAITADVLSGGDNEVEQQRDASDISTEQPVATDMPAKSAADCGAANEDNAVSASRVENNVQQPHSFEQLSPSTWAALAATLPVGGVIQNTVLNCQLLERHDNALYLMLDEGHSTLFDESHQQRLADVLSQHFLQPITVTIRVGRVTAETPAARSARLKRERQAQALQAMRADPVIQEMIDTFAATLCEDTIVPID